ncbi:hypothetical protein FRC11_001000, partial [Ceratobasidium sp. 423]
MKTSLRMVEKFQDLFIFLFVYDSEVPKAAKYLDSQGSTCSSRVRIVTASGDEATPALSPANPIEIFRYSDKSFKLWVAQELQSTTTPQVDGQAISKPSWIIEDQFNGGVSLGSEDVSLFPLLSYPVPDGVDLNQQGNEENGHGARVFENLAQNQGVSLVEAGEMYLQGVSDRLICTPGLPAHHEWELNTQYLPFVPPFVAHMIGRWSNFIKHVDTIVCCTTFEMEPISASALSKAFSRAIVPFFIGPSVDLASAQQSDIDLPVAQFLDRAYTEKGTHSIINPQGWAGNAIFPGWTDQTAVLDHPAIHYFLSHGDWNSSTEALVRGVPMIFWPFVSDQPANAMQIATLHNCGFELLQVRTGPAKYTAYQDGREVEIMGTDVAVREEMKRVLEFTKGPRGEHQR